MKSRPRVAIWLAAVLVLGAGCGGLGPDVPSGRSAAGPYLVILGTAQDGGVPHAACHCRRCETARQDPAQRRLAASIGIVLPESKRIYLIDATPDLPRQLELLAAAKYGGEPPPDRVDRGFLDGVFLTHAHIGHYLGLAQLGYEVMHAPATPVHVTPRMAGFLRAHGPWSQLVEKGEISLHEMAPGSTVDLGEGVRVSSFQVPHRDEFSDTVGFRIDGPRQRVLFVPDTDAWERWVRPLEEVLSEREGIDVALLDGTFYSGDELPGRDVATIPHPLIATTLDRLFGRVAGGGLRVEFIHLNHSNPALEPASAARREIERRGFRVAVEGSRIPL